MYSKEKSHAYYLKNRGRILAQVKKLEKENHNCKKFREKNPTYWKEYFQELKHWAVDKLGRKCVDCGLISEFDCIYDFHHLGENSWSKGFQRSASNLRIKEFIKWKRANSIPDDVKLLCANCHRIKHN